MKKILVISTLIILLLSACVEAINSPAVDRKTPLYETVDDYHNRSAAEKTAIDTIVNQFGYDPSQILLLKTTSKTWTDTCLEIAPISEICTPEEIPGYFMLFYADYSIFEVHIDTSTQKIFPLNYLTKNATPVDLAVLLLANQLGISSRQILVQSSDQVDWPDSCLGVTSDDLICIPVTTPGFQIQLEALGTVYVFHADIYGSRLIPMQ